MLRTYIPKKLRGTIKPAAGTKPMKKDTGGYNWNHDPFSNPMEKLSNGKNTKQREYGKEYRKKKEFIKVNGREVEVWL